MSGHSDIVAAAEWKGDLACRLTGSKSWFVVSSLSLSLSPSPSFFSLFSMTVCPFAFSASQRQLTDNSMMNLLAGQLLRKVACAAVSSHGCHSKSSHCCLKQTCVQNIHLKTFKLMMLFLLCSSCSRSIYRRHTRLEYHDTSVTTRRKSAAREL